MVLHVKLQSSLADGGMEVWSPPFEVETTAHADWLAFAARALVSAPYDEAIAACLERIGTTAGADRAWMLEYNRDLTLLRNTHEWCRRGITSHVNDLQDTPVTLVGELQAYMQKGQAVTFVNLDAMPRSTASLQGEFRRQGIASTLTVPLFHRDRLRGAIGVDATSRERRWPAGVVAALSDVADLFGRARFSVSVATQHADGSLQRLIYLRGNGQARGVPFDLIVALRSEGNYSRVHLQDGSSAFDSRPLKWWEVVLPHHSFARVHRSGIVNVSMVAGIRRRARGGWELRVEGIPEAIPVSRAMVVDIRSRLGL